jgi:hypothetical protein
MDRPPRRQHWYRWFCSRCGTHASVQRAEDAAMHWNCPGCGATLGSLLPIPDPVNEQRRALERLFSAPAAQPTPPGDRPAALPVDALGRVVVSKAVAAGPIFRRLDLTEWRRRGVSIPHPPARIAARYRRMFGREPRRIGQAPVYSLHEFVVLNLVVLPLAF